MQASPHLSVEQLDHASTALSRSTSCYISAGIFCQYALVRIPHCVKLSVMIAMAVGNELEASNYQGVCTDGWVRECSC